MTRGNPRHHVTSPNIVFPVVSGSSDIFNPQTFALQSSPVERFFSAASFSTCAGKMQRNSPFVDSFLVAWYLGGYEFPILFFLFFFCRVCGCVYVPRCVTERHALLSSPARESSRLPLPSLASYSWSLQSATRPFVLINKRNRDFFCIFVFFSYL